MYATSDRLDTWLIPSGTTGSRQYHESTMVWRNVPLLYRFLYFILSFSTKRAWRSGSKHFKRWHVTSDHGWLVVLSRPGRSGGDEPGVEVIRGCVHKRRALSTRLSSGTSAGTFACPAGPYRNCRGEAGMKNEPNWYFVPVQKKGSESWSSRFESKISLFFFKRFRSALYTIKGL